MTKSTRFNWKLFFVLWIASLFGSFAVLPYALTLQATLIAQLPIPLSSLIVLQTVQNAILFALVVAGGMFFAYRVGLGAPILEAFLAKEKVGDRVKAILLPSIGLAIVATLILVALQFLVFAPALKAELGEKADILTSRSIVPPAWQGFLASFYGGIDEELLTRWFLLSLFAFFGKFVNHTADGRPTTAVLWMANILAAVLFGAGHLPTAALLVPLTPMVVTSVIVGNAIFGVAAGYLYFTRGLESAMLAHFTADLILHVLFAL